ncbi:tRNA (adenosine(37)-N6)-threonylcarbamoyltransferase complex ATPase subunit type 1 TsaE [Shimia sp.]|uniref:tRNA (adenosine(37)-N6)-threonylcarbamoyltransferase complex ATPase subunit type 1 TsaE n=1 Tax=Shimia sp. TaxID=1954381 RepID=UPI003B8C8B1A
MITQPLLLTTDSHQKTSALAVSIGNTLRAGDVVLLEGPIGAGKTHFARSLIQSQLESFEDVPSPTFTLVQVYEGIHGEIWHADLYRLSSPDEVVELGLMDAFEDAICLVEWPDRLADLEPKGALKITFSLTPQEDQRVLKFSATSDRWTSVLDAVRT